MKPKFIKELDIKWGARKVKEYRFKRNKNFTEQQIKKVAEQFNKHLQKKNINGRLMIAVKKDYGWRSGKSSKIGDEYEANLPDKYIYYDASDFDYENDKPLNEFSMYVLVEENAGGNNKNNNCLWLCLRQVFVNDKYLPDVMKSDYKMKRFLKLKAKDKIPVDLIPKLENKIKTTINIVGDHLYTSPCKYPRVCTIKLCNGHYTLQKTKSNDLIKRIPFKEKQLMVYQFKDDDIFYYTGKEYGNISFKEYDKMIKERKSTNYHLIKVSPSLDLKEEYNKIFNDYTEIKKKSNGFIDLFKLGKYKNASLYAFHCMNFIKQSEPIELNEAQWIDKCFQGGLIYAENDKTINNAISYDINSQYPYILQLQKISFPLTKPKFIELDELPKDYFKYGIYRCQIENPKKENIYKIFRFNKENYYTHYDLQRARELNLKINLLKGTNFLHYEQRVSGHQIFKPFIDYFYNLKKQGVKGAKQIMNSLWGALCEHNYKIQKTGEKPLIIDGELSSIIPFKDGYLIESYDYDNYYKTNYARFGPFITAYARCYLGRIIEPFIDNVYRIHTDGFIVDKEQNLNIGDDLGQFKIEKQGKCIIKNKCKVEWI